MLTTRLLALANVLFVNQAIAHPGHDAPSMHFHSHELIATAALVVAIGAAGMFLIRRK